VIKFATDGRARQENKRRTQQNNMLTQLHNTRHTQQH